MKKYNTIDLFAGAGGLSLGFMQTGKFDIKVAFENNPSMQETYKKNHPGTVVLGDVCSADYNEIQKKYGPIDVVIGGPPCQGFSNANRQKTTVISTNNLLVKRYIQAITELRPKAFLMENVSMLKSDTHRFFMSKEDSIIVNKYHIPHKPTNILLIDNKYVFPGITDIILDEERIGQFLWSEEDYIPFNVIYKASKNVNKLEKSLNKYRSKLISVSESKRNINKSPITVADKKAFKTILDYYSGKTDISQIKNGIEAAVLYQQMLTKAKEILSNNIIIKDISTANGLSVLVPTFAILDYLTGILTSKEYGYVINQDVVCAADYGAPQKRMRYVVLGIRTDSISKIDFPTPLFSKGNYRTVKDAIFDLEKVKTITEPSEDIGTKLKEKKSLSALAKSLRDSKVLYNHLITKTTPVAMERFKAIKQGQNFHSLDDSMKTNTYTDVSRTQNTVYLRLKYDEPSGTVINVRKSMWIHPTLDRAISVREAARLQTFPDSFVFCGSKDKQYQQVGNAVPPILAKALATQIANYLDNEE